MTYTAEETLEFLEQQAGDMEGIDPITYLSSEVAEAFDLSSGIYPGVSTDALNKLERESQGAGSKPHYWSRVRPQLLEAAFGVVEQTRTFIESPVEPTEIEAAAIADREYATMALKSFRENLRYLKALPDRPTQLQLKVCSMVFQLNEDASLGALTMGALWASQGTLQRLTNEYLLKPSETSLDSYLNHVLRYYVCSWEVEIAEDDAVVAKAAQEHNAKLVAELEALRMLDESGL